MEATMQSFFTGIVTFFTNFPSFESLFFESRFGKPLYRINFCDFPSSKSTFSDTESELMDEYTFARSMTRVIASGQWVLTDENFLVYTELFHDLKIVGGSIPLDKNLLKLSSMGRKYNYEGYIRESTEFCVRPQEIKERGRNAIVEINFE
ncbi:MAG: hypothetical protein AAB628_01545 [Patescibacteria group bacterium]